MTLYQYDPENYLVSLPRALGDYVRSIFDDATVTDIGPDVVIEEDYPDTSTWRKETPLDKIVIHFAQDDQSHPVIGFGIPGADTFADVPDTDPVEQEWALDEVGQHIVNYDVGIWVSAEMGGVTGRAKAKQVLDRIFATAGGRVALNLATGGINVIEYTGGANQIDRVNDVPLWRVINCTLVVRVFSKFTHQSVPVPDIEQDPNLTIVLEDGSHPI